VSVDFSSAFDMVDHSILLGRLYTSFGISGAAVSWLHSYLTNRSQCVRAGQSSTFKQCSRSATRLRPRPTRVYSLHIPHKRGMHTGWIDLTYDDPEP